MDFPLWDLDNRREMRRYHRHEGGVNVLAFASDGKHALSGADDRTVRMWEMPRMLKKR